MARRTIALDGKFDHHKFTAYLEYSRQEHNFGSPEIPNEGQSLKVTFERGVSYPYPVYVHMSWDRYILRRTAADVRLEPSEINAVSFVETGSMIVTQGGRSITVRAGEGAMISMNLPYAVDHYPDDGGCYKAIYTLLPKSTVISPNGQAHCPVLITNDHCKVAMIVHFLTTLHRHGSDVGFSVSRSLFDVILGQLTWLRDNEERGRNGPGANSEPGDLEWTQALALIEAHFSNRLINLNSVAQTLGISRRSLIYCFTRHNTTFSRVLWDFRVSVVRSWLLAPAMEHLTIKEIAFAAGFKSAAHLSTMFKARLKCSPSGFRASNRASRQHIRIDFPRTVVRRR